MATHCFRFSSNCKTVQSCTIAFAPLADDEDSIKKMLMTTFHKKHLLEDSLINEGDM